MFSDMDLIRTIDDDVEVPDEPDSASDDEDVSSVYNENSPGFYLFLGLDHDNTMFWEVHHGNMLFEGVVLCFVIFVIIILLYMEIYHVFEAHHDNTTLSGDVP